MIYHAPSYCKWSHRMIVALYLLVLAMTFNSCYYRRELEVMHPTTVRIRLDVDWLTYVGEVPTGMTLVLFNDKNKAMSMVTPNAESEYLDNLEIGHYRLVLFNKSVNDFPSMRFENMTAYDKMDVRATTFTPSRYTDWTKGEIFTYDPEMLGTVVDEFDITEEMLLQQTHFYPYKAWMKWVKEDGGAITNFYIEDDRVYVIEVTPRPIVSRLYVHVHIRNVRNMASIEGYITGFADGWHLTEEHATPDDDTRYLLDKWTLSSDDEAGNNAWALATTTLWGEPYGLEFWDSRAKEQHQLTLHLTLRDGSTMDYHYDVGKMVRYITAPYEADWNYTDEPTFNLLVTISEPDVVEPDLPDVPGKDESGKTGFDVEVEPWEFGNRVDIPL